MLVNIDLKPPPLKTKGQSDCQRQTKKGAKKKRKKGQKKTMCGNATALKNKIALAKQEKKRGEKKKRKRGKKNKWLKATIKQKTK
jgi:hypothetical protein